MLLLVELYLNNPCTAVGLCAVVPDGNLIAFVDVISRLYAGVDVPIPSDVPIDTFCVNL